MIVCENVTKVFTCGASWERLFSPLKVTALDGVSFEVPFEKPLFVHGSSGSGKSVLLNLLAGHYPPDSGSVRINEQNPWTDPEHKVRRAVVRPGPDDFDSTLSSRRNLRIVAEFYGLSGQEAQTRVSEALDFVGIGPEEQTVPVGELSIGTQSLVSFASALVSSPDILILDEPERFLDPGAFRRTLDSIQGVIQRGMKIILASPRPEIFRNVDGNRITLSDGVISERAFQ